MIGAVATLAATLSACGSSPSPQIWWQIHTQCPYTTFNDLSWSPDGTRIAYTADPVSHYHSVTNIYVLDVANPQRVQQLTGSGTVAHVRWSPDGQSLFYNDPRGNAARIYRISVDGTGAEAISPIGYDLSAPSPDGTTVAAAVSKDDMNMIAVVPLDGSAPRVIDDLGGRSPDWSPDGKHIVFVSDTFNVLNVMDSDGGNPETLTPPGFYAMPVWSPDGLRIAFVGDDPAILSPQISVIYVLELATKTITKVAPGLSPSWSPDSKQLAFILQGSKWPEIAIINVDGTGLTQLTRNPGNGFCPH